MKPVLTVLSAAVVLALLAGLVVTIDQDAQRGARIAKSKPKPAPKPPKGGPKRGFYAAEPGPPPRPYTK